MNDILNGYKSSRHYFSALLLTFMLTACGGSSDTGGTDDGGSNNNYSISLPTQQLDFNIERGGRNTELSHIINVGYKGDGLVIGYAEGVVQPDWLFVNILNDTVPARVELEIRDPLFTEYALGETTVELRFLTGSIDGQNQVFEDLTINVNVVNAIVADKDELSFLYEAGSYEPQQINVTSALAAYENDNFSWQMTSLDSRIILSTSGSQISSGTVDVTLDLGENLIGQSISSEITLTNLDSNSQVTIPIKLDVIESRVFAPNNGVFLTENTNLSVSEQKLKISSNSKNILSWDASTDAEWIDVTSSGNTGEPLIVTLNNTSQSLEKGIMHYASIKLFAEGKLDNEDDLIKVGYYASDEEVNTLEFDLRHFYTHDPIRPYIYQIEHEEFNTNIQVINILTGIEVSSIEVARSDINYLTSKLTISADGSELFYYTETAVPSDDVEDPNAATLYALDLTNFSIRKLTGMYEYRNTGIHSRPLTFGRGLYRDLLITDSGRIIDAESGETLTTRNEGSPVPGDGDFAISANGRFIFNGTTRYNLTDNIARDEVSLGSMLYSSGYDYSISPTVNFDGSQLKSGGGSEYFYTDEVTHEYTGYKCHRYINARGEVIAIEEISNTVLELLLIDSDGITTDSYQYDREYPGGSWVGTYSSNTCTIQ